MRKYGILGGLIAALAGCLPNPAAQAAPDIQDCGAQQLQYLIGQNKSVLDKMRFSQPVRVLTPGARVTKDYRAERLNIDVDAKGTITQLRCG